MATLTRLTRPQAYALACCYDAAKGLRRGLIAAVNLRADGLCDFGAVGVHDSTRKALELRGLIETVRHPERHYVLGHRITAAGIALCESGES